MNLAPKQRDPHWDDKAQVILKEIVALKEKLNQLPESHCFERYPHLHTRMDHLINAYMQILNSKSL